MVLVPLVDANVIDDVEAVNDIPVDNVKLPYTDILGVAANVPAYPVKSRFLKFDPAESVYAYVPPVKLKLMLFASDNAPVPRLIAVEPEEVTLTT